MSKQQWKLVPVVPTHTMCAAAPSMPPMQMQDLPLYKAGWGPGDVQNRKRWIAMLAVAPAPDAEVVERAALEIAHVSSVSEGAAKIAVRAALRALGVEVQP
jgi:hypothetical protein